MPRSDWMHHPKLIVPLDVPGMPGMLQLGRYNQTVAHAALDDHQHDGEIVGLHNFANVRACNQHDCCGMHLWPGNLV